MACVVRARERICGISASSISSVSLSKTLNPNLILEAPQRLLLRDLDFILCLLAFNKIKLLLSGH